LIELFERDGPNYELAEEEVDNAAMAQDKPNEDKEWYECACLQWWHG